MNKFWSKHNLFRKLSSSLVIALHLLTASHIQEAFAHPLASSTSYELKSSILNEGGGGSDSSAFHTKLLLHADGPTGSKNFKDEKGKKVAVFGDTHIDTTQSKFSGASALFDGNGDYLALDDSNDWNFGEEDFTIDFWVRFNDVPAYPGINEFYSQLADNQNFIRFYLTGPSFLTFYVTEDDKIVTLFRCVKNFSADIWYHIALVRNGNNWHIFINGLPQPLSLIYGSYNINMPDIAADLDIGVKTYSFPEYVEYLDAYIDEYRISKGIARWTSDFTPPSAPYDFNSENSGGQNYSSSSFEVKHDSLGEPSLGTSTSASYSLSLGFNSTLQSDPPELLSFIPNFTWKENECHSDAFDLDSYFSSPDERELTYTAIGNEQIDIEINPVSHWVSFSQEEGWSGKESVLFIATDTAGNSTPSNEVTLLVESEDKDNPPILDYIADISVRETEQVKITPNARDLDGDTITYSFTDPLDVQGEWQTTYDDVGEYNVTVTATDSTGLTDSQEVKITVRDLNREPVLEPIADIEANEGELVTITPQASDPDGSALTFDYEPPFDSQGKWQTGYDDEGTYQTKVTVSDGTDNVSQHVKITVNNTNRCPEVTLTLDDYTVEPYDIVTVHVQGIDADGDALSLILTKDGETLYSGPITETYTTNTHFSDVGDYSFAATVTDEEGLSVTDTKGVDVVDPNVNRDSINPVMGDFNGDSLTDLGIYNSDTGDWEICLSDGGVFRNAVLWISNFGTEKEWCSLGGDFNGDGLGDIGIYNSTSGELQTALSNGIDKFIVSDIGLTFSDTSYAWRPLTGNFNGDKYTDFALCNRESAEVRVSLGSSSGFQSFTTWIPGDSSGGDGFSVKELTAAIGGDFNGDGLTDICLFKKASGEFKVAFSDTESFIDASAWISGFAKDKNPIVSEFNSDGQTDIGYWENRNWRYALSTGKSFVDSGNWLEDFGSENDESYHTGDFNGDGVTDAACFDKDGQGIERWKINLFQKEPSDLLTGIDNGTGGKTSISYQYASVYDNDELPFPVYVAKTISSIDTLPVGQPEETYTQEFSYRGGWYDAEEREFRGFNKVTVADPVTNNYTETWFYQGKAEHGGGALKGRIEKVSAYDGNKLFISEVKNTWDVREAGGESNCLGFPYIKETSGSVWEENGSSLSTRDKFTYDNLGNLTVAVSEGDLSTEKDNKIARKTYAPAYEQGFNRPLTTSLEDKNGTVFSTESCEYDSKGNLNKEILWCYNPLTEDETLIPTIYSYDCFGNIESTTNPKGAIVSTQYETAFYCYPKKITNSLGHSITYEYDARFGTATKVTDTNGAESTTVLDSLGRVIREINAGGDIVTSYEYPDFNTKVTTQLGLTTTEYIDGLARGYKSISSGEDGNIRRNVISEVFFNKRGLKDYEILPHYENAETSEISYLRYEYNARGEVFKTISDFPGEGKDACATTNYLNPLYSEQTDPQGHRKGILKDVFGNNIQITDFTQGGTYKTNYEYDLQGNLTKVMDVRGNITQIWYDSLGRKLKMDDPDMGIWNYEYDDLGNLIKQTDAKGQTVKIEYDALNRPLKKTLTDTLLSTADVSYSYDDTTKDNCLGRLSRVSYNSGETEFFYDKEGREIKSVKTIDDEPYTVQRSYDILDRLASITYPDGEVLHYTYDINSGLLEQVTGDQVYVPDITYNASGQMLNIQYGNNTQTHYNYGNDLRLSQILTEQQNGARLQDLTYNFDKNGNLTSLYDNLTRNERTYIYDDLDRLVSAGNIPNASSIIGYSNLNYQYDSIGNMTYKSDVGFMNYGEGAGPHAVTSAGDYSYIYDANGNMMQGKNRQMEYDVENRLTRVTTSAFVTQFVYDGDGGRVKKQNLDTGECTIYVGNLYEIQDTGSEQLSTKHIFAGSNRVCSVKLDTSDRQRAANYYHSDHLGSSNVVSDEDGNSISNYEYQPYGTVSKQTGNDATNYKFTGKELDSTGLYYYGARYYDPEIGRFITADTVVQAPFDPQILNRYAYCRNNPLKYIDPTGHQLEMLIWTIIIMVVAWAFDQIPNSTVNAEAGASVPIGPGGGSPSRSGSSGYYPSSSSYSGGSSYSSGGYGSYQSSVDLLIASIYEGATKYNKTAVTSEDPVENNIKEKSIDGNIQSARDAGRVAGPAGAIEAGNKVAKEHGIEVKSYLVDRLNSSIFAPFNLKEQSPGDWSQTFSNAARKYLIGSSMLYIPQNTTIRVKYLTGDVYGVYATKAVSIETYGVPKKFDVHSGSFTYMHIEVQETSICVLETDMQKGNLRNFLMNGYDFRDK